MSQVSDARTVPATKATSRKPVKEANIPTTSTIDEVLQRVSRTISPVWPLKDYVAVNPYFGMADRSFASLRAFLRGFSNCETLMPFAHYAEQYRRGDFGRHDIEAANRELSSRGCVPLPADLIVERLDLAQAAAMPTSEGVQSSEIEQAPRNDTRPSICTVAQYVDTQFNRQWVEVIGNEVSRHCSAHYDQGQAAWESPWKALPLYEAWRQTAERDRNIEVLGLTGIWRYVSQLPHSAEEAIIHSLNVLGVPPNLWEAVLLCEAFSGLGWSAWTRYKTEEAAGAGEQRNDFTDLLAIRLAYEAALAQVPEYRVP